MRWDLCLCLKKKVVEMSLYSAVPALGCPSRPGAGLMDASRARDDDEEASSPRRACAKRARREARPPPPPAFSCP